MRPCSKSELLVLSQPMLRIVFFKIGIVYRANFRSGSTDIQAAEGLGCALCSRAALWTRLLLQLFLHAAVQCCNRIGSRSQHACSSRRFSLVRTVCQLATEQLV